jgi:hypothetical protein
MTEGNLIQNQSRAKADDRLCPLRLGNQLAYRSRHNIYIFGWGVKLSGGLIIKLLSRGLVGKRSAYLTYLNELAVLSCK